MTLLLLLMTFTVSVLHAIAEAKGALWRYFANSHNVPLLNHLDGISGTILIVLPALAAQIAAGWFGLAKDMPVAAGMLIGLRLGDAIFSHLLLWLAGNGKSPGQGTAWIYLADSSVLIALLHKWLWEERHDVFLGSIVGAGVFFMISYSLSSIGKGSKP